MYKNIIRIAFLLATGICMTACSSGDDDIADKTTPVAPGTKDNVVILTGTIRAGGETTRALDTDGKTVFWKVGDEIRVEYELESGFSHAKGVITELSNTHDATFRATLINPKNGGRIGLAYPYDKVSSTAFSTNFAFTFDYTGLANQKGTTAYISDAKLDYASSTEDVTLNTSTNPAKLSAVITLQNQVCICKFNVKDGGTALNARALEITLGDHTTPDYKVIPDNDQSVFYVALPAISGKVKIEASTCGDNGAMVLDSEDIIKSMKSTDVGKYISVDASNQAYLCKNLTTITDPTPSTYSTAKICKHTYSSANLLNGKFYELNLAATSQELTPIAVVASVGEVSNYWSKFLALALNDIPTTNISTIAEAQTAVQTWAGNKAVKIAGTTYNNMLAHNYDEVKPNVNSGSSTSEIVGDWKPSKTRTEAAEKGWRIPSVTDWRYVIQGLGDGTSATSPVGIGDHNFIYSGDTSGYGSSSNRSLINGKCGNLELQNQYYWSSSYYQYTTETKKPWRFNFDSSRFEWNSPDDMSLIRAVLAY